MASLRGPLCVVLVLTAACASKDPSPSDSTAEARRASSEAEELSTSSPATSSSGERSEAVVSGSALGSSRFSVRGPNDNPDPHLARRAALEDAKEHGMIGLLNSGAGGDPDAPTAPWGKDPKSNMWGDEIGDAFGAGGLGLSGIGEGKGSGPGGGGNGEGIGLGNIGTIGHGAGTGTGQGFGSGSGRLGGTHREKPPSVRMGATSVNGALPPEVIQRIVRQNFGRFRLCYENGLRDNPELAGMVTVSFTIQGDGSVSGVSHGGDLPNEGVKSCVSKAFIALTFPKPESGTVKVRYPIAFAPGGSAAKGGVGATGGGGGGTTAGGGTASGPTIGGKSLTAATGVEVEKSLRDAGCTDVSSAPLAGGKSAIVFTVKKGGKTFTITFAPASAGADAIPAPERARLEKSASVRQSGAFFLAVEGDDKAAAKALLDALVVSSS